MKRLLLLPALCASLSGCFTKIECWLVTDVRGSTTKYQLVGRTGWGSSDEFGAVFPTAEEANKFIAHHNLRMCGAKETP